MDYSFRMPQAPSLKSVQATQWTDAELDAAMAHPHYEPLGDDIERLMAVVPATTASCERTTVLTWVYQQQGVMSFLELSERITGNENLTIRKRQVRATVRGLEKLFLVKVDNFAPDPGTKAAHTPDGAIGETSLVSLTHGGMIWLRRAWVARAKLVARAGSILAAHQTLTEEEAEGKANDPFWVENITNLHPDGPAERARAIAAVMPGIASVFDLARTR